MARQLVGLAVYVLLFAALLFGPAGTLHWRAAWILLAVLLAVRGASTVALYRVQRSLLDERARLPLHREQPLADRLLLPAVMASFAGVIAFAAWERWHRPLLAAPTAWLRVAGLLMFAAGWWGVHRALRTNAFAVAVVRHQAERAQRVVTEGPYAIVRHPMYASLLPVMTGLALWLASLAALCAVAIPAVLLAVRIGLEERVLRDALPDYVAYSQRVRWRLVPGVW